MGDLWKQLTKSLSPQWLLFSFMPAFAFWFLALGGWAVHEHKLRQLIQKPGVFESVIFLVLVVLSAWILSMLSKNIVMFFEGYLLPSRLRKKFLAREIRKWETMRKRWATLVRELKNKNRRDADYIDKLNQFRMIDSILVYNFPSRRENIMPTDIGNILKASEEYPRLRYGIDPIVLWEHLYSQLPPEMKGSIDTAFNEMALMLTSSLLSFLLAVEWFALAALKAVTTGDMVKWLLAFLFLFMFLLFSIDFYKISVIAALKFSKLIRASFDLYRDKLAKELGYELPKSLSKELKFWRAITLFFYRGIPPEGIK